MASIYGIEVNAAVGSYILPDGWKFGVRLTESTWEAAAFRLPSAAYANRSTAVNVRVTGRTWQRLPGGYGVRVEIEVVGDGEPSTRISGYMVRD